MKKIIIISGIHGNEPSGPHALFKLLRDRKFLNRISKNIALDVIPLLNPSGFITKTRHSTSKKDLNRFFSDTPKRDEPWECKIIRNFIGAIKEPYDLLISLHEDYERKGFYLYATNLPDASPMIQNIFKAVKQMRVNLYTGFDTLKTKRHARNGYIKVAPRDPAPTLEENMSRNKKARSVITLEIPGKLPLNKKSALALSILKKILLKY